jgi:hypothetical protein
MTPEMITDEEREVIYHEFKEWRLPGWMFKRILDSERHAWSALEEAEQRIQKLELYTKSLEFSRESAQKMADGIKRDKGLELYEAQQTIARQREALIHYAELVDWEDDSMGDCARAALGEGAKES